MAFLTICIFLIIVYGLGAALTKDHRLMKVACGLAAVPVLAVVFNLLRVPIDWRIFFGLALAAPVVQFVQWRRRGGRITRPVLKRPSWNAAILTVVFLGALVFYCWGPFQYLWLENDDPWSHAASIRYVSIEQNLNAPEGVFQYLNPYPPGYAVVMGLLNQIHPSVYWVMKFFNGFIICLGFLFFYVLALELMKHRGKAAAAVFFLAVMPCYLTHFIWAHSLVVVLFFPAFYFFLKSLKERGAVLPAGICCAAVALTQPTQAVKFVIMALILAGAHLSGRIRWRNVIAVVLLSGLLAGFWWGPVALRALQGRSRLLMRDGWKISALSGDTQTVAKGLFDPSGGTATRAYALHDYIFIRKPNLINNPTGLGPVISLLALAGLLWAVRGLFSWKDEDGHRPYFITMAGWTVFTFLGMNSMTFQLPVGLFAFRFWMLFAVPVAFLSVEGLYFFRDGMRSKWKQVGMMAVLIISVAASTLPFKWRLNTTPWHYGSYWDRGRNDINGHVWMRLNLPPQTMVFAFTDNILVLGHDMRADFWRDDYEQALGEAFHDDLDTLHTHLMMLGFDFLIVSPRDVWRFGREDVNTKLEEFYHDRRFHLIHANDAVKIFHILKMAG